MKPSFTIGIILLVILIGFGIVHYSHPFRFQSPVVFLPESQQVISSNKEKTVQDNPDTSTINNLQAVSGASAIDQTSYEKALQTYSGRVVQLNDNCRATPVTLIIPIKTVVMLDNRSPYQRSVIVGPRTYAISGNDYMLASFNDRGQYAITCDSVQSVSIISVQ